MNHYSIHVELNRRDHDLPTAEHLLVALKGYSVAVGTSPFGWLDVQLTVPADSLTQATQTAIALATQAAGVDAIRVEAMAEDEFEIRQGHTPAPYLVGAAEAGEILGVTKQRIAQMFNEGKLAGQKVGNSLVLDRAQVEARAAANLPVDEAMRKVDMNNEAKDRIAEHWRQSPGDLEGARRIINEVVGNSSND